MDTSVSVDGEARSSSTPNARRGGWITFPFIIASTAGIMLAGGGWTSNLIVYLIKEFHVESIDAAQISNVINGFGSLIPVLAAILADSFLGCFFTISISSLISLLGIILLALTASIDSLRPCKDEEKHLSSVVVPCSPTKAQFAVLYLGVTLACLGLGGMRTTIATLGANQFKNPKDQGSFFNWFFFTAYTTSVVATTVVVYIEDNVSWKCGFLICVAANALGLAIFLAGRNFYSRNAKPEGSPFTALARVFVASVRKRKFSHEDGEFYYGSDGSTKTMYSNIPPTKSFRFLNRAALRSEEDMKPDGSISNPWRLCTVKEVEDFKSLLRILSLWSTSIFLGTPIAIQASLSILQALTMDRHVGPHFQIPAGSMLVFTLISSAAFLPLLDKILWPTWKKLSGKAPTPLRRIGVGHLFTVLGMATSAIVESKRRDMAQSQSYHGSGQKGSVVVPMSVAWLVPQLAIVGVGEAFHYPGQVALYYQEFPDSLKNVATAMISVIIAISFYLGTALVDFVRRLTNWLPNDINQGRLDNVYWVVTAAGVLNFGYYLVCAWFYKYQKSI